MKERSVVFSAPMVQSLLLGVKSQTRRIVKPQPSGLHPLCVDPDDARWYENGGHWIASCPYGRPGDRLWVRETWALVPRTAYRAGDGVAQRLRPDDYHDAAIYKASFDLGAGGIRWRSPIHMPRWASRITLEVTNVRIERLHDISEADAQAEGVDRIRAKVPLHRDAYRMRWEDIHCPGAWEANCWVWVVHFKTADSELNDE